MVALKIIFADNVFEKLKEEAAKRGKSATNTAYTIVKEQLGITGEEDR